MRAMFWMPAVKGRAVIEASGLQRECKRQFNTFPEKEPGSSGSHKPLTVDDSGSPRSRTTEELLGTCDWIEKNL